MTHHDIHPYDGIFVPLVTPFLASMEIDWAALERLVRFYAGLGLAGFVPCGSTGEASTLSMQEHKAVISFVTEKAKALGDFRVVAATGSNSTQECLELTAHAKASGADACLVVTPYYVRPNRSGLLAHYGRVSELDLDVLLYNIPLRAGLNLTLEDIVLLHAKVARIVGIKEATSDIGQLIDVAHHFADDATFTVLSGEDALLFDCCVNGGRGSICATALVYPREVVALHRHLVAGQLREAASINRWLRPRVKALFCESNPVAIKHALSRVHGILPITRAPLGPASAQAVKTIDALGLEPES
ncbi:4-hydroxy-tetrahydrodipicolinate synthase [Verminephrobacter aporrectodeae subsp. tuberculatae]|uniref:4-hydroxy-tetrahydrodipicolinate synthase n=1 Tax=Verminephrobacter aporrectodeae TaxID=1110389 RepID=UPI002242E9CF|nr:4-hydroxy-tetrahydrodipicolinate synthase [Verminephrobacter aporrectodeae]MCW8165174.1 4-hydroxy-tetrahydrodipicolinate synthase [Verminephrobacter aporrectodeae subsp. tuberculatae]MCW8168308.1 4-hydroxy-tetrahydrodipicolinate synthase [Verminephrobacter aporrectodeae subsp. tuberculatae]